MWMLIDSQRKNIKLNSHTAANRKKMMNPGKDRVKEDSLVW